MQIGEDRGFNLLDFIRIVRVHHKLILGTTAIVLALVTIIVLQLTPLYTATSVVMLDQRKNSVEDTAAVLSGLPSDQATIQNQVQILTSLELAGRVVEKLKLDQDPEFNPKAGGSIFKTALEFVGWMVDKLKLDKDHKSKPTSNDLESTLKNINPLTWLAADSKIQAEAQGIDFERGAIVRRFLDSLTVSPIGLSTAMKVSFQSKDADKAARIANTIANAYVEDQLEAKFDATQKATQWLSGRISDLSRQAQLADAAVQQYKAEHNISVGVNGVSVLDQQIADINRQLIVAKMDLAEKQASYGRLYSLSKAGLATNAPQVVASPLIGALRAQDTELTRQIADLSSKYGPRHPKMLDLQAQKANLDSKIAEEVQRVVESGKNEVGVAQAHVASLQQSLQQIEEQGAGQNKAEVELTALQSAATSARTMYEAFLGRLNQTQGQEGIQTPDARIISKAEVPQSPSFPKKTLAIGIAIPAGLILGLMLAFMAERLDSGFKTSSQLERLLGVPVLSTIPEITRFGMALANAADLVIDKPMSSFAESIRGLQVGLMLSNVDKPPKVILVTSSVPGEGKTTLAVSLARIAARGGTKTIVVDGDLRRPTVAKAFGGEKAKVGLIEVLTGNTPAGTRLGKDPRSDVVILPCLQTPASPADVLASEAMQELVANLRKEYDLVIIDSAPMLPINDTKILSRLVDAVLFVVRWEKTPRDAAVDAMRALADVHAPVAGVALARADYKRFRYYSYGYAKYYKYSKYYND